MRHKQKPFDNRGAAAVVPITKHRPIWPLVRPWFRRAGIVQAAALILAVSVMAVSAPAANAQPPSTCPEMTDSVRRLFMGIFTREPNATEAFFWTSKYMNGEANLPQIADDLIRSSEFETRYGPRTTGEFVDLIYRNTRRPLPPHDDLRHWITALDTGYTRGRMVLALTESEDYVSKTNTARPLAGYLRWYPPGTHWYCGGGSRGQLSVQPLVGSSLHADYLFRNAGASADSIRLATVEDGFSNAVLITTTLQPGVTDYEWGGKFIGNGFYGSAVDITAQSTTSWVVVFYPRSIGYDRLGWQISP